MSIGRDVAVFMNIESPDYSDEEKAYSIWKVVEMPTHNGISKRCFLEVIWWLLRQAFDVPEGARGPYHMRGGRGIPTDEGDRR